MTADLIAPGVLPVRVPGDPSPAGRDRLVLVADPVVGDVAVRWQLGRAPMWRCKACGPQYETADCVHVFAAALRLARDLLGLESVVPTPTAAPDERNQP